MKVEKYRYFAFLVYPDSAPLDWWEKLRSTHCAYACSPLHSPDGEETKEHYHCIYRHDNTITLEAARRRIPADVPANGYVEPIVSPTGAMRYLLHLDDGDKQQWTGNPLELIRTCGGFPLDLTREYTAQDRREQRAQCFKLMRDNDLVEYSDLLDGLLEIGLFDVFDWACSHTILLNGYLTSKRNRGRFAAMDR